MRGGTVLALGLLFSLGFAPAAAQEGTGGADVFLKEQGDESFAGEDLLSRDGDGQSRSLIVTNEIVLVVVIENDDDDRQTFSVEASPANPDWRVTYRLAGRDVTKAVTGGTLELTLGGGRRKTLRILVNAQDAAFADRQRLIVFAGVYGDPIPRDAARAEITNLTQA